MGDMILKIYNSFILFFYIILNKLLEWSFVFYEFPYYEGEGEKIFLLCLSGYEFVNPSDFQPINQSNGEKNLVVQLYNGGPFDSLGGAISLLVI